jgi:ribonuclease HI
LIIGILEISQIMKLLLNCDGGSRGNPGPAAYGFIIQDITSGAVIILEKCGNYLGVTTNNQAEYAGLIAGVRWVVDHHPLAELTVQMDSLLIVNQIKGEFKVKHPDIIPRYREAMTLLALLPKHSISYVPRAQNAQADELVNLTLDAQL